MAKAQEGATTERPTPWKKSEQPTSKPKKFPCFLGVWCWLHCFFFRWGGRSGSRVQEQAVPTGPLPMRLPYPQPTGGRQRGSEQEWEREAAARVSAPTGQPGTNSALLRFRQAALLIAARLSEPARQVPPA